KLTLRNGDVQHIWIDAKSFLDVKVEGLPRRMDGKMRAVWINQRDFRSVHGVMVPYLYETANEGNPRTHKMVIEAVEVNRALDDGRPVLLNFIFTTCSSICPLTSRTLEEFQDKLGPEAARIHLMSISIDPEQDTPSRLSDYARKFHAGPEWQYYTGTVAASLAAQRAFDVYRGEKMSHTPVTLMRAAPGKPWLRIEGFVTPAELVDDYRNLLAAP